MMKTQTAPDVSRHRLAVLTMAGAYPTIIVLLTVLDPWIGNAPSPLKAAILVPSMVGLLTYVIMPALSRLFADWLEPTPQKLSPRCRQAAPECDNEKMPGQRTSPGHLATKRTTS
tara:strand:+ start:59052 stop:59396 length:345 start_codon:yes stop_codon:yes gene_type:complete